MEVEAAVVAVTTAVEEEAVVAAAVVVETMAGDKRWAILGVGICLY